jgi:hypothetical protein
MTEIVNLRNFRKRRERALKAQVADENRARHGQSADQKAKLQAESERNRRQVEGHRRDDRSDEL